MNRSRTLAFSLLSLCCAGGAGCKADIANHTFSCKSDRCPPGQVCGPDKICVDPSRLEGIDTKPDAAVPPGDSGTAVDADARDDSGAAADAAVSGGSDSGAPSPTPDDPPPHAGQSAGSGGAGASQPSAGAGAAAPSAGVGGNPSEPSGTLSGCDAPEPDCRGDMRDMRELRCGRCNAGTATQTRSCSPQSCTWGDWSALSACAEDPAKCEPGSTRAGMEPCGACNSGTRPTRQTCSNECSWGPFSASGECTNVTAECTPGTAAQTRSAACTTCGTGTQSRSCNASTCRWNAWSAPTACTWCEQCSEVVYCDTPADIANRGTWCRQGACSREQALADCMEDVGMVCGSTVQPFFMEYR